MKRGLSPDGFVGNGEFLSRAAVRQVVNVAPAIEAEPLPERPVMPMLQAQPAFAGGGAPALPLPTLPQLRDFTPQASDEPAPTEHESPRVPLPQRSFELLRRHFLGVCALLFLLIGMVAIKIGGGYLSANMIEAVKPANATKATAPTIAGLNLTVPAKDLQSRLQTITNQPATLTVGDQTVPVGADTIRGWLQISANKNKSEYYVRIKAGTIAASLQQLAQQFVKSPVNQVTVNEGGANVVVVGGRNGTTLTNPGSLKIQADQVAKTVMDGKGLNFSTPLQTQAFQSVTPAAFDKLIDVNLTTKQMYVFQNGQQIQQYGVSAGGPATPTPQGEFHIYEKLPVQDMWGYGPGHKYYFQPHVYWINYFTGGDAVHGVYWHPLSWFGAINSSHGCVGLSDDNAEWIYNWAPIGTTVITHA